MNNKSQFPKIDGLNMKDDDSGKTTERRKEKVYNKDKRIFAFLNTLRDVPGGKEYVFIIVIALLGILVLTGVSSFIIISVINVGDYAQIQVSRYSYILMMSWLVLSVITALIFIKVSSMILKRVSGPIKRMEMLLDKLIEEQDFSLVLREEDALFKISEKINHFLEMRCDEGDR